MDRDLKLLIASLVLMAAVIATGVGLHLRRRAWARDVLLRSCIIELEGQAECERNHYRGGCGPDISACDQQRADQWQRLFQ